jgi:SsrA-binding protein
MWGKDGKNICVNKKAGYEYFLEEKIECGIKLHGVEIKSVYFAQCNLKNECFCRVENGEVYVYGFHISPYNNADGFLQEEPDRPKKLLLHKKEILKLEQRVNRDGYTLVPTRVYFSNGKAKMEIAVAKGKKLYDKRETIKKNDVNREIDRSIKKYD